MVVRALRDVIGRRGCAVVREGDVLIIDEADIAVNAWDANGPCGRAAWVDVIDGADDYCVAIDVDDLEVITA